MADIIVQKGETILNARVVRSSRGLVIKAKAHPCIEEFFRDRAKGQEAIAVTNWGRAWTKMPEYPELFIYPDQEANNGVGPFIRHIALGSMDGYYSLTWPGKDLLMDTTGRGTNFDSINMGFLRCKGISENMGIAFSIKGAFTSSEVNSIAQKIQVAAKRFYLEYLRPVDVQIIMTTQEATVV